MYIWIDFPRCGSWDRLRLPGPRRSVRAIRNICVNFQSDQRGTGDPFWGTIYGSVPINTIFRGMNIHLPAILMFTRGTRF